MKRYIKAFFVITILFIFFSCNRSVYFSNEKEIETVDWKIEDSISFILPADNLTDRFNIYILLDIYDNFLTNNLWLFIETKSPSGITQTDTIMYYITDEKGKWYGNIKRGVIKNKFLYKADIKFPEKGDYTFILKHGMREGDIPKVKSIGLDVEYFKEEG